MWPNTAHQSSPQPRCRKLNQNPMPAGYSKTPLSKKLGIKAGHTLTIIGAPTQFASLLQPLPAELTQRTTSRGRADVLVFFTKRRSELSRRIPSFARCIHPAGSLWVCWPKKASKVPTDMTEDVVREVVLPRGLVDVKVCAIDETWSGLKIMWRKDRR